MRLQNVDDLLLSGGRRIELASHLCEPSFDLSEPWVDLGEALVNVAAEVDEVLPKALKLAVVACRKSRSSPRIAVTSRSAAPASTRAAAASRSLA